MQRLFSTFASGWPGKGLLIQRALIAAVLAHNTLTNLPRTPQFAEFLADGIALVGALLLVVGVCTPIAAAAITVVELWFAFSRTGDPWTSCILAVLSGTLAMIGPGAWSVDAHLFGRKHIDISNE